MTKSSTHKGAGVPSPARSGLRNTIARPATGASPGKKRSAKNPPAEPPASRPRRVRAPAMTRQRLIAAAMEVVAERGFDEARSEEIVRRAGLTNGALYAHFKNKNELLLAAFAEQTSYLQEVISEVDATGLDEVEKLIRLVRSHPVMPVRESIVGETLARARRDGGIREIWLHQLATIEETYARWIRTGQAKGIVRPEIEPHVAARLISSLGTGYQVLWEISAPAIEEQDWIASLCGVVESFRR